MSRRIEGTLYNYGGRLLFHQHCYAASDTPPTITVEQGTYGDPRKMYGNAIFEHEGGAAMPDNLIVVVDVKRTPGAVWASFGHGWEIVFRCSRDSRRRARHARMCKGKHNLRRPR